MSGYDSPSAPPPDNPDHSLPAGDLKRSSKLVDFSRERSFVVKPRGTGPNLHHSSSKPRLDNMATQQQQLPAQISMSPKKKEGSSMKKPKPTLEIYRPPTRTSAEMPQNGNQLNVHAKEFSANKGHHQPKGGILMSKSSGSLAVNPGGIVRPSSSSSSSSTSSTGSSTVDKPTKKKGSSSLSLSRSSGDLRALQQSPQRSVHFFAGLSNEEQRQKMGKKQLSHMAHQSMAVGTAKSKEKGRRSHAMASSQNAIQPSPTLPRVASTSSAQSYPVVGLKRSKSMSAAADFMPCSEAPNLGPFSPHVQAIIRHAVQDPNDLPARALMELVRNIFERIAEDRKYALPAAQLCIKIIEKEQQQETFLESLLNTCLQWYRQREQEMQLAMKGSSTSPGSATKWLSFLSFLNEMYQQLKRRELQLQTKTEGVAPDIFLLGLMHGCLISSLDTPAALNSLAEIDSIFIIIMCIGSDLEREQPQRMLSLMASVRDALLSLDVVRIPKNRRTLLELIEVRAASWKLPAPAVMYYYPSSQEH
ncbi:uncharacterized protein DDB_G0271670 isoform X1 [Ischnura elegans]|uniref:uncharacterized protein DDB_G0271670 isoform X1 n=1 Tax=Ischnura elegans TaxID=197161 RepID=UPI001ED8BC0C|nr:uncharacterized protein DDB_G0271670 isoform X1 [Ischnura elegans]